MILKAGVDKAEFRLATKVDFDSATAFKNDATPKSVTRLAPRHEKEMTWRQSTSQRAICASTKSVTEVALTKAISRGTKADDFFLKKDPICKSDSSAFFGPSLFCLFVERLWLGPSFPSSSSSSSSFGGSPVSRIDLSL